MTVQLRLSRPRFIKFDIRAYFHRYCVCHACGERTLCIAQDPLQRITLQKVMQHPWVTKQGAWPLRTMKEMLRNGAGPDDDDDDLESFGQMPDLMATVNVLDVPRQVTPKKE